MVKVNINISMGCSLYFCPALVSRSVEVSQVLSPKTRRAKEYWALPWKLISHHRVLETAPSRTAQPGCEKTEKWLERQASLSDAVNFTSSLGGGGLEAGKTLLQSLDLIHSTRATQPASLLSSSQFFVIAIPLRADLYVLAPRDSPLPFLLAWLPCIMKTNIGSLQKMSHCVGISVTRTGTGIGLEISQHRRLPDLPGPSKSCTCDSRIKPTHRLKPSCQRANLHPSPEAAWASSLASLSREGEKTYLCFCATNWPKLFPCTS